MMIQDVKEYFKSHALKPTNYDEFSLGRVCDLIISDLGPDNNNLSLDLILESIDSPKVESNLVKILGLFELHIRELTSEYEDHDKYFDANKKRAYFELASYLVSNYDKINTKRLINECFLCNKYDFLMLIKSIKKEVIPDEFKGIVDVYSKYVLLQSLENNNLDPDVKVKEYALSLIKLNNI